MSGNEEVLGKILWEMQQNRKLQTAILMHNTASLRRDVSETLVRVQYSFEDTVEKIATNSLGCARFGDGELRMIFHSSYDLKFQKSSSALSASLKQVLLRAFSDDRVLLCLPNNYRGDIHWLTVWADVWGDLAPLINGDRKYGNAHVTRPIFFSSLGRRGVDLWRNVWGKKDVLIVTGKGSRFEMLPQLFDGVASFERLDSLPVDAFSDLPRLLNVIPKKTSPDTLVLISLGPAGTVLASELCRVGIRALDIGHISDSYQTVFEGKAWPESKPVKK